MLVKLTQCKNFFFISFFLLFLILTYSQTCVQGPPQIKWPLLTGGRCSKVNHVIKAIFGTWWSLWTGGHYSEVVVSQVYLFIAH
jgi:hypothetical protein